MQPIEGQLERGSLIGGYRIDEPIGHGGMGVVYRVTNLAMNRIYALKVLPPGLAMDDQYRERFKREMRLAASIHHPNVVGVHHAGEDAGRLYFVMDFIYGIDLRQALRTSGALDPGRAVDLLTQVTSALDAAHARGLVHRDVKPANILITVRDGEETAYLTDFGVAKRADAASDLTAEGVAVGTVDYMAPEQINGGRIDARTDVYALGCVFFQMLTGKVPYERENSLAKLFAHVHDPPPQLDVSLADLYPAFGPVIETAMAKRPEDRYLSAGDFSRDAAAALRGLRYSGPPTSVATGEATPLPDAALPTPSEEHAAPDDSTVASPDLPEPSMPAPPPESAMPAAPLAAPTSAGRPLAAAPAVSQAPPPSAPASPRRSPGRYRWPLAGAAALVLAGTIAAVVVLVSAGGSSRPPAPAGLPLTAAAQPVPTNRVTGGGTGRLVILGDTVTVSVTTHGLLNGSPHAMHIHAGGLGICPPASAAKLHNGHRTIATGDGLKFYGSPQASLTEFGDTSPKSIVDFPRYPSTGDIHYSRTFTVTPQLADDIRAGNAVLVIHGIDYNGNGVYDGVLGVSDLYSNLPGEATAPALCGPLVSTPTADTGTGATEYVVTLRPYTPTPAQASAVWLLCHLMGIPAPALRWGQPHT